MKVRVILPEGIRRTSAGVIEFADDVELWAMELEQAVELYSVEYEDESRVLSTLPRSLLYKGNTSGWIHNYRMSSSSAITIKLVFTIDPEFAMFFMLKWGAVKHKRNIKDFGPRI